MYWQAVKFPVNSFFCLKYLPVWGRSTPSMCDDIRAWKSAIQKNKRFIGELESFNIFYIKFYEITSRKMYIGHQNFHFSRSMKLGRMKFFWCRCHDFKCYCCFWRRENKNEMEAKSLSKQLLSPSREQQRSKLTKRRFLFHHNYT